MFDNHGEGSLITCGRFPTGDQSQALPEGHHHALIMMEGYKSLGYRIENMLGAHT